MLKRVSRETSKHARHQLHRKQMNRNPLEDAKTWEENKKRETSKCHQIRCRTTLLETTLAIIIVTVRREATE